MIGFLDIKKNLTCDSFGRCASKKSLETFFDILITLMKLKLPPLERHLGIKKNIKIKIKMLRYILVFVKIVSETVMQHFLGKTLILPKFKGVD